MSAIRNSYIVSFDSFGNPGCTILSATQCYNWGYKRIKQGSSVAPYPDAASVYRRLAISCPEDDMFEDLYLGDM
jgi:hypothetical protein